MALKSKPDPNQSSNPDTAVTPRSSSTNGADSSFLHRSINEIQRSLGGVEQGLAAQTANLDKLETRVGSNQDKLELKIEKISDQLSDIHSEIKSAQAVASVMRWMIPVLVAIITGIAVPVVLRLVVFK